MIDAVLIGQIIQMNARSIQPIKLSQDVFYKRFGKREQSTLNIQVRRCLESTAMTVKMLCSQCRILIATGEVSTERRLKFDLRQELQRSRHVRDHHPL
jgi:hypothetical protein